MVLFYLVCGNIIILKNNFHFIVLNTISNCTILNEALPEQMPIHFLHTLPVYFLRNEMVVVGLLGQRIKTFYRNLTVPAASVSPVSNV